MDTVVSSKITPGSLVGLKQEHENPEIRHRLQRWTKVYGKGPFQVQAREREYVSLNWIEDPRKQFKKGDLVHFGGADPLLHICHVELWRG